MKNKFKPLEKIDALPEEQRHQLADWLLTVTLKKTGELLKEEFGVEIPRSTLNRFRKRCELADYLDTSDESPTARAELINAVTSTPPSGGATSFFVPGRTADLRWMRRGPRSRRRFYL